MIAHGLANIGVHVVRIDRAKFALGIAILEQMLSRQAFQPAQHPGQPLIVDRDPMRLAALAPKLEGQD
ncbi:hypothetical protein D3C87_1851820 [compost metagenome]